MTSKKKLLNNSKGSSHSHGNHGANDNNIYSKNNANHQHEKLPSTNMQSYPISLQHQFSNMQTFQQANLTSMGQMPTGPQISSQAMAQGQQLSNDVSRNPQHLETVSTIFKKTCYLCGNLGHYADTCDFKERLCYNCKEPGHESSDCPYPKVTNNKQCYLCKKIGHLQSECPDKKALMEKQQQLMQLSQFNQLNNGTSNNIMGGFSNTLTHHQQQQSIQKQHLSKNNQRSHNQQPNTGFNSTTRSPYINQPFLSQSSVYGNYSSIPRKITT